MADYSAAAAGAANRYHFILRFAPFLSMVPPGLDVANRPGHASLVNALLNRSAEKTSTLKMTLVTGELTLPLKVN